MLLSKPVGRLVNDDCVVAVLFPLLDDVPFCFPLYFSEGSRYDGVVDGIFQPFQLGLASLGHRWVSFRCRLESLPVSYA